MTPSLAKLIEQLEDYRDRAQAADYWGLHIESHETATMAQAIDAAIKVIQRAWSSPDASPVKRL